jgi:GNAT superfamily N-acetyltransferase
MGTVIVEPARSKGDIAAWIEFPRRAVYDAASPWVSPLDSDMRRFLNPRKNPFFQHGEAQLLLARDASGRIVGRVLAHLYHRHNVRYDERAIFFGYFECLDDPEVAQALIAAVAAWGAERGCTVLRGPFNLTAMQEMGTLLDGFDAAPAVDETYTAEYYPRLLEGAGLQPVFPVTTFRLEVAATEPDTLLTERHRTLLENGRLRVRQANLRQFEREIQTLRDLLNDSFYENPYFVPLTHDELFAQIGPYRRLMDPAISLVAELDGVPCGFVVAVPDFNPLLKRMNGSLGPRELLTFLRERRRVRDAVIIIMGTQRQLQGKGVMRVLHAELLRALRRRGYQRLTITWVADTNAKSLAASRAIGGQPLHRLTLYEAEVADLTPRPPSPEGKGELESSGTAEGERSASQQG